MATFIDSFDRPDSDNLGAAWSAYGSGFKIVSGPAVPAVLTELTSEEHTSPMTSSTITIKDPSAPATGAQLGYLNSLVTQRDLPAVCQRYELLNALGGVTKGQASEWINQLLAAPKKTATPTQAFGELTSAAKQFTASAEKIAQAYDVPTEAVIECPKFGYYQVDGKLYHWDVTGKDYYPQLRRLVIKTSYTGTKTGSWQKTYTGYTNGVKVQMTYQPYGSKKGYQEVTKTIYAPKMLVGQTPLTLEQVASMGKEYTFCVRCGAQLTDPDSVARGMGSTCAKYWGV